jgi:hypothetical protein
VHASGSDPHVSNARLHGFSKTLDIYVADLRNLISINDLSRSYFKIHRIHAKLKAWETNMKINPNCHLVVIANLDRMSRRGNLGL